MCCGKGGDLFKWRKMNATHLICTDLAEVTMQHCQDRYKEMLKRNSEEKRCFPIFTAEFITADCTKVFFFIYFIKFFKKIIENKVK